MSLLPTKRQRRFSWTRLRVDFKILGRLGVVFLWMALSGDDALDAAPPGPADVVLMDINLAGTMDGVEAAGALIAEFGVPVIFLTAAVDRDIMERVAGAGAAGYIQKPAKLLDLKANLEMAITRRGRERPCPTDAAVTLYKSLLAGVLAACSRRLAAVDHFGRILLAHPDDHLAGMAFAEAFPDEPPLPAPADTPLTDPAGQALGWLRLLG